MTGTDSGRLARAAAELCDTAEAAEWRGPDAYDGLWFPWPRPLVGGRRRRQAFIQLHARFPVDIRRLYRRRHPRLAKTLAVFGSARLRLHAATGGEVHSRGATAALDTLISDDASGTPGWGYPFDTQTRWSFYPANSPNVVVTAYAVAALSEAGRALGREDYVQRAKEASGWVQDALFAQEQGFYTYHLDSRTLIHNASLLGARAAYQGLGDAVAEPVHRAVERTLAAQADDGSFPYGEGGGLEFVDSFHTGYVLECLSDLRDVHPGVDDAVARGTRFYVERFFGPEGQARLWPDKEYPEDAHAAGTALTTLSGLMQHGLVDRDLFLRIADRAASHMMRGGHAIYRRYGWGTTRVAYLRWADAHLALGLANAARAE